MKRIISRSEAIQKKLVSYYTGKQCRYGHTSERITVDGSCRQCRNIKQDVKRKAIAEAIRAAK